MKKFSYPVRAFFILAGSEGATSMNLPILLPVGSKFEHELGTFQVKTIEFSQNTLQVWCERVSEEAELCGNRCAIRRPREAA